MFYENGCYPDPSGAESYPDYDRPSATPVSESPLPSESPTPAASSPSESPQPSAVITTEASPSNTPLSKPEK